MVAEQSGNIRQLIQKLVMIVQSLVLIDGFNYNYNF